ncbi:ImpA family metalloprotease [Zhongshania aquimaris]|uniref:ImpA family metalloprotease n=1 Tax=Zhongshania aquimaris TaxID=2857107 RepID=A0ABS6VQG6_9GAMM|nr:ImpA family metalloprotease [Zhongshania aquimaris]MBW2940564.1 ImpA family metalloprotease [Zhongshania aquimaris]
MTNVTRAYLFIILLTLVACGGGGSGGGAGDRVSPPDRDNDGIYDSVDNCPDVINPSQQDGNANGIGDACEGEAPLETVLRTGDVFAVAGYDPKADLINTAIAENSALEESVADLVSGVFGSGAISYQIPNRTSYVSAPSYRRKANGQIPLLMQNGGRVQAMAGVYKQQHARYSLFGSNPPLLFSQGLNQSFESAFRRLVAWLLGDTAGDESSLQSSLTVLVARTQNTAVIQAWFQAALPNSSVNTCSKTAELNTCTSGVDLIVLGKNGAEETLDGDVLALKQQLQAGVPVLYLHTGQEHATSASKAYSAIFGADLPGPGNYFLSEANRNSEWNNAGELIAALQADSVGINAVLAHVLNGDFSFDLAAGLSGDTVDTSSVFGFEDNFDRGASALRTLMRAMDSDKVRIFDEALADYRRERAYALLGDRLRQDVVFPMDILESDQNDFFSSYLADHLVYNERDISARQPDRGFQGSSDYLQVTPKNYSVSIPTRFYGRKPTGAYVLPGQAFSVTRTDNNSDISVTLFWNIQFPGAVYAFRTSDSRDHYNMPKYLQSVFYELSPGETLNLSSSYGGVVHITHSKVDPADRTIDLSFANIGTHPFYNGPDTATDFYAGMASGDYEWAEIVTPETYVTSPLAPLQDSLDQLTDRMGWDVDDVARVASDYYYNEMFRLSGYIGFDIPQRSTAIANFCASKGWECGNSDIHGVAGSVEGNIRQYITNCGSFGGCSNQPVTYTWSWDPLGAGPVHERGHHLEGNSGADYHRFAPLDNHQLTNTWRAALPYFYYRDTGGASGGNIGACGVERNEHRTNGRRYDFLQAAQNSGDPVTYMNDNVWSTGEASAMNRAIITQLAAHAADQGGFAEGWDYFPLVLTMAREFKTKLDEGEAAFDAVKAKYGFGLYSHAEAQELVSNRDGRRSWFLIAYSLITGKDQRNYFTMLGWDYTAKAASQVQALLLLPAAKQFYAFDDVCSIANAVAVPVDGVSTWPVTRPTVY